MIDVVAMLDRVSNPVDQTDHLAPVCEQEDAELDAEESCLQLGLLEDENAQLTDQLNDRGEKNEAEDHETEGLEDQMFAMLH